MERRGEPTRRAGGTGRVARRQIRVRRYGARVPPLAGVWMYPGVGGERGDGGGGGVTHLVVSAVLQHLPFLILPASFPPPVLSRVQAAPSVPLAGWVGLSAARAGLEQTASSTASAIEAMRTSARHGWADALGAAQTLPLSERYVSSSFT